MNKGLSAAVMCAVMMVVAACDDGSAGSSSSSSPSSSSSSSSPSAASSSQAPVPLPVKASSPRVVAEVRGIVAEMLGVKPADIDVSKPLSAYKADELDLVEIVMECEDKFHVSISDEAIETMIGSKDPVRALQLSATHLARLVEDAPPEKRKPADQTPSAP